MGAHSQAQNNARLIQWKTLYHINYVHAIGCIQQTHILFLSYQKLTTDKSFPLSLRVYQQQTSSNSNLSLFIYQIHLVSMVAWFVYNIYSHTYILNINATMFYFSACLLYAQPLFNSSAYQSGVQFKPNIVSNELLQLA